MPRQGRAPSELRQVRIVPGFTEHAEGSVLCTFGRTRVLCTATAEERVPSHVKGIALRRMRREKALRPPVAAVSVGMLDGQLLLDLDYEEDFAAEVDLNVIGNAQGELLEVQGTAEKRPFTPQQLHEMVALAQKGIQDLHRAQTAALAEAQAQDAK